MRKEFTTLGQYFKNLGSQVMRSDSSSESNIVADEKPSLKNRLAKHLVAGAAAVAIAGSANAAIVNWNCNLVPAADIDGMYINVETQVASNGPGSGVPGWDINPYSSGGNRNFFNSTGGGQMRYPGVTAGPAGNLAIGNTVGATGSFNTSTTSLVFGATPGNWQLNATNYLGFRFVSAAGTTHYGWAKINVGTIVTAWTIVQIAYESVAATPIIVVDDGLLPTCTAPTLSATTVAALCAGNANGSIDLTTTGGSPTPLTYAWSYGGSSYGGSTEDLSGLTAGTYSVTVTTQTGGCSVTGSYTVAAGAPNVTYYADADGDGYGAGTATNACPQPAGYVINNLDCNDVNSAISPTTIWYLDVDADGSYVSTYMSCTSPGANYNTTGGIVGDCNDNNPLIRPGVTETCNSIDDDCDALIDENSSNTY